VNQSTTSMVRNLEPEIAAGLPRMPPASVPLARSTRLELLRGMLCQLEDATSAGQRYLMTKVVPLLRREALDPAGSVRSNDLAVINRSLNELEHEASRVAPDPNAFGEKAHGLLDRLARV
jgi:hypothetical protein